MVYIVVVKNNNEEDNVGAYRISREQLKRVAYLVRIKLSDSEMDYYLKELDVVLTWMDMIAKVNTDGVEPMIHGGMLVESRYREDLVNDGNIKEEILSHSLFSEMGYFVVPRAIDRDI